MAMLTQTLSLDRGSSGPERCLRDPSFSSYLSSGTDECYDLNLSKLSIGRVSDGDGEIGVFSAEKYFSERLDDEKPQVGDKSVTKFSPVQDLASCVNPKTQSCISSVRSVSSWNSQSALLAVRDPLVTGEGRLRGRSYFGSFRCGCVCSDKNSVAVDEYQRGGAKELAEKGVTSVTDQSQYRMPNMGTKSETYFNSKDLSVRDLLMIPRKSLDVFGSSLMERRNKQPLPFSFGTEKNLKLNREDGLSRPAEILIPTVPSGAYAESDSDASSDLFEIEEFTSKASPFRSRNMSGSATPTAAYAPSEASIDWSVVTASAADFPITSDHNELRSDKNITYSNSKTASPGMNLKKITTSDKPRRLSSSFLACNSQDSVKVVDHAHSSTIYGKMPETKTPKKQELRAKVFRTETEAKLSACDTATNVRLGISSRSLGQLNSVHGSNMLYFQQV